MITKLARDIATRLAAAVEKTAHELSADMISDEDDFSSRMITRLIDEVARGSVRPSLPWNAISDSETEEDRPAHVRVGLEARRLKSRGRGAEEVVYGADLVAVLRVTTPTWSLANGVLVQAKLVDDATAPAISGKGRLLGQCHKMLQATAEAFVFVYSPGAVRVFNATAVEASGGVNLRSVPARRPYEFFRQFVLCGVGDQVLDAVDRSSLRDLRRRAQARHAFLLRAKSTIPVGIDSIDE